ncbi:MAG: hypothetical protein ACP5N9_04085 [Candidatus Bilamarchaeum sp.]|jgi:hypothetical protein
MRPLIISLLLILILGISNATLGFKFVEVDCEPLLRNSAKIACYHEAAVTAAYMSGPTAAKAICRQIWDIGAGLAIDDNTREVAEIETNSCYYDVARITGDRDSCQYIQNWRGDTSSGLFGEQTQAEMCLDLANKVNDVRNFHDRAQRDSLCNVVYVFVPLLAGAFWFRRN